MLQKNTTLESLYRLHARELRCFARRLVGAQEAEDIVQDAYLHALQRGDVLSSSYPRAYLFRIVANLTIDSLRKARVRLHCPEIQATLQILSEDIHDGEMTNENLIEFRQSCAFLDELPAPCRNAFILYWITDLSQSETAGRLGVTVRTVERHLLRAREHLQRRAGR
jgi:RNA polymerase sigma factor (sigma-70 family)